jgi:metallo-beta-lactamase class B
LSRRAPRRRWPRALLVGALLLVVGLAVAWQVVQYRMGSRAMPPFRIAGNLYYVGTRDVTAFLLAGDQGHVLIDAGLPRSAPLVEAGIAQLGFDVRDVKVLLNSHAHFDHAGGLAQLQRDSGAQLYASDADADEMLRGGAGDPTLGWLSRIGIGTFPPPRVDHRVADGEVVRLGELALTAHLTPGHTRGCTTWTFPVRDGARTWQAVHVCSLTVLPVVSFDPESYPGMRADYERSVATLRALPGELFLSSHARFFDLEGKRAAQAAAADPAAPFLDRPGYERYIDASEQQLRDAIGD